MSYALLRGSQWISAPDGQGEGQVLPPVLALCTTTDQAWLATTLELALERAALLRFCWGWNTEIRALR